MIKSHGSILFLFSNTFLIIPIAHSHDACFCSVCSFFCVFKNLSY